MLPVSLDCPFFIAPIDVLKCLFSYLFEVKSIKIQLFTINIEFVYKVYHFIIVDILDIIALLNQTGYLLTQNEHLTSQRFPNTQCATNIKDL